jgi:hypothetical protein
MANEIRKTAMGMQAVGVGPLAAYDEDRAFRRAPARGAHAIGLGVTIALHAAVGIVVVVMNAHEQNRVAKIEEPPYQAIEAGLAIKKKSTSGQKSKLPQKELTQKVAPPEAPKIASNPDVVPSTEKKDKKPPPPPDAVDPKSVFDKYRKMDTGQTAGDKSTDESNEEGSDDGSEFGTLERQKGDPYVGELIGRMITDFVVPSVVSDQNLKTWGCVKLDESGKIVDRAIDPEHKSRNHAFNSAVEERLKLTTDMDKPVPNYLKAMLVGKFVCATYTSRTE